MRMNYKLHYDKLIDRAQARGWTKETAPCYTEKHHVIPRCAGGTDAADNLATLTAEEHFVAHLLLVKIYKGTVFYHKMVYAAHAMVMDTGDRRIHNKRFGWLRREYRSMPRTAEHKQNLSKANTGKIKSAEHKQKLREANLGKKYSDRVRLKVRENNLARGPITKDTRQKMRDSHIGNKISDEVKLKLKASATGRKHTAATKLKLKEIAKNMPVSTCPHCGKQGKKMKRYHFDKCKFKPLL